MLLVSAGNLQERSLECKVGILEATKNLLSTLSESNEQLQTREFIKQGTLSQMLCILQEVIELNAELRAIFIIEQKSDKF